MADDSNSSIWSTVGAVAPSILQTVGSGVAANQVAGANAEAASGVQSAAAKSAALLNPYATQGTAAETQLASLYGLNGNGAQAAAQANFASTPGYQFTANMGNQAIQRQASATGGEFSSATLGALDQYNTGLAQQTYQNYVQNLFGLVQPGESAASASGYQGIQAATSAGNFTVGKGNANASGVANGVNALTNPNGLFGPNGPIFGGGGGGPSAGQFSNDISDTSDYYGVNGPTPSNYTDPSGGAAYLYGDQNTNSYDPSFNTPDNGNYLVQPSYGGSNYGTGINANQFYQIGGNAPPPQFDTSGTSYY